MELWMEVRWAGPEMCGAKRIEVVMSLTASVESGGLLREDRERLMKEEVREERDMGED